MTTQTINVRDEVKDFAEEMEYKLSLHDNDRGGWKECDLRWLLSRLKEETAEIEKVLATKGGGWLPNLKEECADVGNFAMMLQDAAYHQWIQKFAMEHKGPIPD